MGIFKKLVKPFLKDTDIFVHQAKALIKADKISRGEKVLAPKHPTDAKHFVNAQHDSNIRQKLDEHDEQLVTNMNQISIKSIDPPPRRASDRPLPTKQAENDVKYAQEYEYGFYEPPLDQMQKGRITFNEAMQLLQAKTEIEVGGSNAEEASQTLQNHPSKVRISADDVESLFTYYRPFVRREKQKVVSNHDLQTIRDYMNNHIPMIDDIDLAKELRTLSASKSEGIYKMRLSTMAPDEQYTYLTGVKNVREDEHLRLKQSMNSTDESKDTKVSANDDQLSGNKK